MRAAVKGLLIVTDDWYRCAPVRRHTRPPRNFVRRQAPDPVLHEVALALKHDLVGKRDLQPFLEVTQRGRDLGAGQLRLHRDLAPPKPAVCQRASVPPA